MGKHSNLILTDETGKILDSIKRVTHEKSSVREVLPGKEYVFPPSQDKKNPLLAEQADFLFSLHLQEGRRLQEFLYQTYTGISPVMAGEICTRAGLDASDSCQETTLETVNGSLPPLKNHAGGQSGGLLPCHLLSEGK